MKTQEFTQIGMRPLAAWLKELDKTPITAWRWRKKGWLKTVSIAGRQYITKEAAQDFQRRAEAGEFRKSFKKNYIAE